MVQSQTRSEKIAEIVERTGIDDAMIDNLVRSFYLKGTSNNLATSDLIGAGHGGANQIL